MSDGKPQKLSSGGLTHHTSAAARGILEEVSLPEPKAEKAFFAALAGTVATQIPILAQFFEFFERIDDKLREEKLEILLNSFRDRFASLESAEMHLRRLFSEHAAAILTRKLVQILDRGDSDKEWIDLLGSVLKHLSEAEFETQFEEISYALTQIERLSPQACKIAFNADPTSEVAYLVELAANNPI